MEQQVLDDPKINEALDLLNKSAREKGDQVKNLINERYSNIRQAMGSAASSTTRNIQGNPWFYLGGAAAVFLVAGYFIGRSTK